MEANPKTEYFSARRAVVFVQYIEAMCLVQNAAPNTSWVIKNFIV